MHSLRCDRLAFVRLVTFVWGAGVAVTNQNETVVSAGADARVIALDIETGGSQICESHEGPVHSVAIDNSNPNVIYSASNDATVRRWDLRAGTTADVVVRADVPACVTRIMRLTHRICMRVCACCQLRSYSQFTAVLTHPYQDILVTGVDTLDLADRGAYVFDLKQLPARYGSAFIHSYDFSRVPCYALSEASGTGISGLAMHAEGGPHWNEVLSSGFLTIALLCGPMRRNANDRDDDAPVPDTRVVGPRRLATTGNLQGELLPPRHHRQGTDGAGLLEYCSLCRRIDPPRIACVGPKQNSCFAGFKSEYVVAGSDNDGVYVWSIPKCVRDQPGPPGKHVAMLHPLVTFPASRITRLTIIVRQCVSVKSLPRQRSMTKHHRKAKQVRCRTTSSLPRISTRQRSADTPAC